MALVITVAQQKGGTGKTTLAAHLAAFWAASGRGVALLDIDPQRSLARWHALRAARRPAPAAIGFADTAGWRLAGTIEGLRRGVDVVLIDSPPQVDTDARQAIRAADLVLVPIQPSPPDLWAAEGTLALAASERRALRLVLNRAPTAGRLRAAIEAELATRGLPRAAAVLGNRIAFANAFAAGLGVTEAAPRGPAAAELRALAVEIEGILR
ncbi:MAG: AAA family ATPase [Rhodospirillales bacterium]|nr:AAA family ATPase [Rhodospirillales bacterium]